MITGSISVTALGLAGLLGLSHPQKVVSTSPATFDSYLRFKSLFSKPLDIMKDPSSQRLKTHCFSTQFICSKDTRSKHSSLFRLVSKVHLSGSTFIFFPLSLLHEKPFQQGKLQLLFVAIASIPDGENSKFRCHMSRCVPCSLGGSCRKTMVGCVTVGGTAPANG